MSVVTVRAAALAAGLLITAMSAPALATPVNLVTNGDFSAGNTGFTSEYSIAQQNTAEGQYNVLTTPDGWNPWFIDAPDHAGAGGGMLVVNGAGAGSTTIVWQSQFDVIAGTNYTFEAFAMNVCCTEGLHHGPNVTAALGFYVNDDLLATLTVGGTGVWFSGGSTWNSGLATSVTLALRDANVELIGNDFAVDDIFFGELAAGLQGIDAIPNPEPATWTLLVLGGLAAAWARRRQSRS